MSSFIDNIYKIDEKTDCIKYSSHGEINHDQKLQQIIYDFPNFNRMPMNDSLLLSKTLITFMDEAQKGDFDILYGSKFHQHLMNYITIESKPNIFIICIEILNKILTNTDAKQIATVFLNEDFAQFIFIRSIYIYQKKSIPYTNTNKMCLQLLEILLNLIKNDLSLYQSLKNSLFFQKICIFYQTNENKSILNKILDIIIFILSQEKIKFDFIEIEPVFQITHSYFSNINTITNAEINCTLFTFTDENFQGVSINFDEFSKFCQLIIQLAQRDLAYFYQLFNTGIFFRFLLYLNQNAASSLIDFFIFILQLITVPYEFIESIIWEIIDYLIVKFNAVKSNDSDFIIKICQFIKCLVPHKEIEIEQINDLISFIEDGSFKMRENALFVFCHLFLNYSHKLFELGFENHLEESVIPAIFIFLEYSNDIEFLHLLLSTLIKSIDCFKQNNNNNDIILKIQDFCSSENFNCIFDKENAEEIIPLKETLLAMLS